MRNFPVHPGYRLATVAIILLISLLSASAVFALAGSSFGGGDGNLIGGDAGGAMDWANAPNRVVAPDKLSGNNDDSFKRAKENDPDPIMDVGSIPKHKSDLLRFYVANEQVEGDDFLYLGWVRGNTEGSTNMDFEFNQSEQLSSNGVTPLRTSGDILITFQLGGSDQAILGMSRWDDPADDGVCEAGSPPCWGPIQSLEGSDLAEGAVNSVVVNDPIAGGTLEPMTFGEAAINLTLAGVFDNTTDKCVVFGSAYLKSRSSDSFSASLKDFIAPVSVSVSNCATLNIVKDSIPNDPRAFSFSTQGGMMYDFSLVDDGDPNFSTETFTIHRKDLSGTYSVAELGPGLEWDLTGASCDDGSRLDAIALEVGDVITCTFTNIKRGQIVVVQETIGGDASFGFNLTGGPDSVSVSAASPYDSDLLRPGSDYSISQTLSGEWDPTGLTCESSLGTSSFVTTMDRTSMGGTIDLAAGDIVTCTFSSTKLGHIFTDKITRPSGHGYSFGFTLSGGPDFVPLSFGLADGDGLRDGGALTAGSYTLSELAEGGWDLTHLSCTAVDYQGQQSTFTVNLSSGQAGIDLAPGGVVTCT